MSVIARPYRQVSMCSSNTRYPINFGHLLDFFVGVSWFYFLTKHDVGHNMKVHCGRCSSQSVNRRPGCNCESATHFQGLCLDTRGHKHNKQTDKCVKPLRPRPAPLSHASLLTVLSFPNILGYSFNEWALRAHPHCAASLAGISAAAVAAAASNSCRSSLLGLFYLSAPPVQRRYGAELNISRTGRLPATFDPPRQPVKHLISELSPCLSSAVFSPLALFFPSRPHL